MTGICFNWRNPESDVAARAARRELHVVRQALLFDGSPGALGTALAKHVCWLERLLGCSAERAERYVTWRLTCIVLHGMPPDIEFLADATQRLRQLIEGAFDHAA